jgi:hypothetical protein
MFVLPCEASELEKNLKTFETDAGTGLQSPKEQEAEYKYDPNSLQEDSS